MTTTVVLLEGDSDVRSMVGVLLRSSGHDVVEARDPVEAEHVVEARRVDVLLADSAGSDPSAAMELFSGFGRRLGGKTRVVLFTAHAVSRSQARALGCAEILTKPFDIGDLLRLIDRSSVS